MTGMMPTDIGLTTQAGDLRLSPDGSMVAFTVGSVDLPGNRYRSRVWLAACDGSSPPYPFTAGEGRDLHPRWSPDGRRLAYVTQLDAAGDDGRPPDATGSAISVMPVTVGGQAVRVSLLADSVSELAWSPDGARLAYVGRDRDEARYGTRAKPMSERDMPPRRVDRLFYRLDSVGWTVDRPNRVFVVPSDGSTPPRAVTTGAYEATGITWSPDSRELGFSSARHDDWDLDLAVDLWRVSVDGAGEPHRLTETGARYGYPTWSPDGRRLACLLEPTPLDEPRHTRVAVIDLASGEQVRLTDGLDRTCAPFGATRPPAWEGDNVIFSVEDAGNVHLYQAPADGRGKPELIVGGDRAISSWDCAGGATAFVASTPVTLNEVFVGAPGRQLTGFTDAFSAAVELSPPVRFLSTSPDGTEVEGWAIAPVGAEPGRTYPTLLNIHGGPYTQYGNRFFDEFQVQAGAGFGVVYCNPRGSSGYSEAFARAIRWPEADSDPGSGWGGVDFEDIMACAAEAERRFPWIDSSRFGVMGGSYGGYMTSWIVGHTDRFGAACSERACNNLLTLDQSSDIATSFRTYVGKSHLEAPELYMRQSPISHVEKMSTPVLILHSEGDLRCPINQAEELFVALRTLGRQPVMVRFPGESHELSRSGAPRHRVMRAELILDWFTQQLA